MDVGVPPIRFAQARIGRLAYQQWGEGVDIVGVPPLAQNIELAWGWPDIVAMFRRFGRIGRYLHYDKRGTGASDRLSGVPGQDERVDDMRAVMDAAGVGRAWLFGVSDGGPTALLFAATYPERVHGVVTFGSGGTTVPPDQPPDVVQGWIEKQPGFAAQWGTSASPWVDGFAPSLAGDQAFRDWHQRYERSCCDSSTLLDLIMMSITTDVREALPELGCPVVLLHRTDDRVVDVARSHEAAAMLPHARVVEVPGIDHFGYVGDMAAWIDELERTVTGTVQAVVPTAARPTPTVRVVTLGRFGVEVDGVEVPTSAWGSRHARTIVKRLAVARGWPVTRDELFELLWPGETDRGRVGARLSVQLSTVRRVLRGGVIADRESVRLDLDEVELDLSAFDAAIDDGAVLAAWTGEFLPGDAMLPWTAATRAEVATRAAAAGVRAAQAHLVAQRPGLAAEVARRLVESNPLDLRAHELLVGALLDTDQHSEAAAAHAAWTAAGVELGVHVPPLGPD